MHSLYTDLAEVYEAMYHTFMDYDGEYQFYGKLLEKYNTASLLELGCGNGNMAKYFEKDGLAYAGMDLSEEMLNIARKNNPQTSFFVGDIATYQHYEPVDTLLMIGRTISYLMSNANVLDSFYTALKNLKPTGVLIFDIIDASRFIPAIQADEIVVHEATHKNILYRRETKWTVNLKDNMCIDWDGTYYQIEDGEKSLIGTDIFSFRSFMEEEIRIFLNLAGFQILEVIDKPSYAFPTKVFVAQKI